MRKEHIDFFRWIIKKFKDEFESERTYCWRDDWKNFSEEIGAEYNETLFNKRPSISYDHAGIKIDFNFHLGWRQGGHTLYNSITAPVKNHENIQFSLTPFFEKNILRHYRQNIPFTFHSDIQINLPDRFRKSISRLYIGKKRIRNLLSKLEKIKIGNEEFDSKYILMGNRHKKIVSIFSSDDIFKFFLKESTQNPWSDFVLEMNHTLRLTLWGPLDHKNFKDWFWLFNRFIEIAA